jgi:predicted transposase/invertase (TIGR01784 family)
MISVHAAKDAWDTAIDEAKAEGYTEGRAEGMEKGMVTANRENAKKMKALGLSSDVIAQVTGLTAEEIEGL